MVNCPKCKQAIEYDDFVKYGAAKYHPQCEPKPRSKNFRLQSKAQKEASAQAEADVFSQLDEMDAQAEQERNPMTTLFTIGKCHDCNETKVVLRIVHRCFNCIRKSYIALTQGQKE